MERIATIFSILHDARKEEHQTTNDSNTRSTSRLDKSTRQPRRRRHHFARYARTLRLLEENQRPNRSRVTHENKKFTRIEGVFAQQNERVGNRGKSFGGKSERGEEAQEREEGRRRQEKGAERVERITARFFYSFCGEQQLGTTQKERERGRVCVRARARSEY